MARPIKAACLGVWLALASGPAARADTPDLLGTVMAAIARLPATRTVPFTEHRTVAALTTPVERAGTLAFERPDRLEQDTTRPKPERLVISGDTLTDEVPGTGPRTIPLDSHPVLAALAETLRAVLAGDGARLRALYDLDAEGELDGWRLLLTPRATALRDVVVRVTVDGTRSAIRQIDLQFRDGDEQRISIGAAA